MCVLKPCRDDKELFGYSTEAGIMSSELIGQDFSMCDLLCRNASGAGRTLICSHLSTTVEVATVGSTGLSTGSMKLYLLYTNSIATLELKYFCMVSCSYDAMR